MKVVFDTCLYLEQAFSGRLVTFIFLFFSRLDFFLSSFSIERIRTRHQTQSSYCFAVFFLFVCFFFVYFEISSFLLHVCWKFFRRMQRTIWMARSYF